MNAEHAEMIARDEAVHRVTSLRRDYLADHPTNRVPMDDIPDRTLVTEVVADTARPEPSPATMDGYALDATDAYPLALRSAQVYPESAPRPSTLAKRSRSPPAPRFPRGPTRS